MDSKVYVLFQEEIRTKMVKFNFFSRKLGKAKPKLHKLNQLSSLFKSKAIYFFFGDMIRNRSVKILVVRKSTKLVLRKCV